MPCIVLARPNDKAFINDNLENRNFRDIGDSMPQIPWRKPLMCLAEQGEPKGWGTVIKDLAAEYPESIAIGSLQVSCHSGHPLLSICVAGVKRSLLKELWSSTSYPARKIFRPTALYCGLDMDYRLGVYSASLTYVHWSCSLGFPFRRNRLNSST